MIRSATLATTLCLVAAAAMAQSADAQKKQLAERAVALWKPENIAVVMIQRPAVEAFTQSRTALQGRVTQQKMEETLKSIQADVQTFIDQATPIAVAAGKKADTDVVIPMLMRDFTVEELKQLVTMLESPVRAKFDEKIPAMQKALGEKVSTDVAPQIDPKLKAMTESVGTKLRNAANGK